MLWSPVYSNNKKIETGTIYAIKCGLKPQATNSTAWTSFVMVSISWILPNHHIVVTWWWYSVYLLDSFQSPPRRHMHLFSSAGSWKKFIFLSTYCCDQIQFTMLFVQIIAVLQFDSSLKKTTIPLSERGNYSLALLNK